MTYRDQSFTSAMTGDVAPLPAVPWMQNMDDSIEGFYRNKPRARVAVIGCGPSGKMLLEVCYLPYTKLMEHPFS